MTRQVLMSLYDCHLGRTDKQSSILPQPAVQPLTAAFTHSPVQHSNHRATSPVLSCSQFQEFHINRRSPQEDCTVIAIAYHGLGPGQSLNPERCEFTLKMRLKAICIAFQKISGYSCSMRLPYNGLNWQRSAWLAIVRLIWQNRGAHCRITSIFCQSWAQSPNVNFIRQKRGTHCRITDLWILKSGHSQRSHTNGIIMYDYEPLCLSPRHHRATGQEANWNRQLYVHWTYLFLS